MVQFAGQGETEKLFAGDHNNHMNWSSPLILLPIMIIKHGTREGGDNN